MLSYANVRGAARSCCTWVLVHVLIESASASANVVEVSVSRLLLGSEGFHGGVARSVATALLDLYVAPVLSVCGRRSCVVCCYLMLT